MLVIYADKRQRSCFCTLLVENMQFPPTIIRNYYNSNDDDDADDADDHNNLKKNKQTNTNANT